MDRVNGSRRAPLSVISAVIALSGCASYNTLLMGPDGHAISCDAVGLGVLGVIAAESTRDACVSHHRALGYVVLKDTGSVGLALSSNSTVIAEVVPASPAAKAGLKPGDTIVSIGGKAVNNPKEAGRLLMGPEDTTVEFVAARDGGTKAYKIKRRNWADVTMEAVKPNVQQNQDY